MRLPQTVSPCTTFPREKTTGMLDEIRDLASEEKRKEWSDSLAMP